jgi:large subunit ribosomal protein L6
MSRIGRSPISLPGSVTLTVTDGRVSVAGPNGTLERAIPEGISIRQDGDVLVVERPDDEREHRALHGLTRSLVANMVQGVTEGYSKELEIVGVGYRAQATGPGSLELAAPTRIIVKGIDKEAVGQVAANLRKLRKPEPYKGKGVRYAGERVMRKAGKAQK